jgi:hypothetical protein
MASAPNEMINILTLYGFQNNRVQQITNNNTTGVQFQFPYMTLSTKHYIFSDTLR